MEIHVKLLEMLTLNVSLKLLMKLISRFIQNQNLNPCFDSTIVENYFVTASFNFKITSYQSFTSAVCVYIVILAHTHKVEIAVVKSFAMRVASATIKK